MLRCEMKYRRQYRNILKFFQNLSSKQFIFIAIVIIIFYTLIVFYSCHTYKEKSETILKNDILKLSQQYVNALAKDQENVVDGPYSGRFTGYDLKKTFAVLLQNMLERISNLERLVGNRTDNLHVNITKLNQLGTMRDTKSNIDFKGLINGKQDDCSLSLEDKLAFPECDEKIEWMKKHWKTHVCYNQHGVDGSTCSIIIYLSEVENYCPQLKFRVVNKVTNETGYHEPAELNLNLTQLYEQLSILSEPVNKFMKRRINKNWPQFVSAAHKLNQTDHFHRTKKNILVYMGFLSKASKIGFAQNIFKGGPLGEIVQWTDLLTGLFILGHDLNIFSELEQVNEYLGKIPNLNVPCQVKRGFLLDIIYTDIIGFNQIVKKLESYKCVFRILDSFGTHAISNNLYYLKSHKLIKTPWNGKLLELKQFNTLFPHTPDNSYLGFVIETPSVELKFPKERIALIYGKHISFWKGMEPYLNILKKYFEIHATLAETKSTIPNYIINHGFLFGTEYSKLLAKSMVFVGFGLPNEGPAPIEAIAHGSVFINPKMKGARYEIINKFFKDKPTMRRPGTQHPYIEDNIGKPYSYIIDLDNMTNIEYTIQEILRHKLKQGVVPYEMSHQGYLERLFALSEYQDFCNPISHHLSRNGPSDVSLSLPVSIDLRKSPSSQLVSKQYTGSESSQSALFKTQGWPPISNARFFIGVVNESCLSTCKRQGYICESSFTEAIMNHRLELQQRGVWCENVRYEAEPIHPSYEPLKGTCYFQTDHLLFSCFDSKPGYMRFCGCRDYIVGQSEICKSCL